MKASARQVERHLADPDPRAQVFLIYGDDTGLVRERAERLCAALVPDPNDPFAVTRLTDEDLKADPASLADAMAALSMIGGARLVRLRLAGEAAAAAAWIADFESGAAAAEARLVIESGALRATSKLRKTVEGGERALALPCYADSAADLAALAESALAEEGLTLEPDARAALGPILEGDRLLARSEIEKLILYKGLRAQRDASDERVTRTDVADISAAGAETGLDAVIEPALAGLTAEADRAYQRALAAGVNPVGVLRALQRRIDQIDAFHGLGGSDAALARAGAPRFGPPAARFKQAAKAWAPARLDRARGLAFEAERAVKRSGAPAEAIVGALLLRLARAARPAR